MSRRSKRLSNLSTAGKRRSRSANVEAPTVAKRKATRESLVPEQGSSPRSTKRARTARRGNRTVEDDKYGVGDGASGGDDDADDAEQESSEECEGNGDDGKDDRVPEDVEDSENSSSSMPDEDAVERELAAQAAATLDEDNEEAVFRSTLLMNKANTLANRSMLLNQQSLIRPRLIGKSETDLRAMCQQRSLRTVRRSREQLVTALLAWQDEEDERIASEARLRRSPSPRRAKSVAFVDTPAVSLAAAIAAAAALGSTPISSIGEEFAASASPSPSPNASSGSQQERQEGEGEE